MTYTEIFRQRINAGDVTFTEAMRWLTSHGMLAHVAARLLRGDTK